MGSARANALQSSKTTNCACGRCTDEEPSLQTLWQYGLRFRVEELFLDSKSGAFQLEESRIRWAKTLERLYLVVSLAILFSTSQSMAVQLTGLRQRVDPHWKRGLSYLKIGLRWLKGVLHKGRALLSPVPLLLQDPQSCDDAQAGAYQSSSTTNCAGGRCTTSGQQNSND